MNLPAFLTPPPLRAEDGLGADTFVQPYGVRWYKNPAVRFLIFALVVAGLSFVAVTPLAALGGGLTGATVAWLQIGVSVIAYLVLTMAIERRVPPYELAPSRVAGLGIGLLLGAALFAVCFGLIAAFGGYRFEGVDPGYRWAEPLLVLGASAGIAEEIMLRGVLFRLGEELLGTWFSAILSGLVFGFLHLGNPEATLVGATAIALEAGIMFALLYALTRSLWICIGLHAAWNIVQGPVLGVPVSGSGFTDGWLNTVQVGPEWLTGGRFGAEASLVTVLVMVLFTLVLAAVLQRSGQVAEPRWSRRMEQRDRAIAAAAPAARPAPEVRRTRPPGRR